MTSASTNRPMPVQEKLEWVTPKISLMGAEETERGKDFGSLEPNTSGGPELNMLGPS